MDKQPIRINIAIGILCVIQFTLIGCGDKNNQPPKAVTVSKKIVAKSSAVTAPVQVPVVEAGKQPVSPNQPAETVQLQASGADKGRKDAGAQAEVKKTEAVPTIIKPAAPSPTEQLIAAVSQAEIQKMQPEGIVGYNPEGKTDPFVPLFKEGIIAGLDKQSKEKRIPRTPLEMIDIGQLKLVAVMHAKSGNKALVEETSGKGYIVAKGSYMGINSGRVVKILKDSIVIEEEVENILGKRTVQERELKLQKPLGEE